MTTCILFTSGDFKHFGTESTGRRHSSLHVRGIAWLKVMEASCTSQYTGLDESLLQHCFFHSINCFSGHKNECNACNIILTELEHMFWCHNLVFFWALQACPCRQPFHSSAHPVARPFAMAGGEKMPDAAEAKVSLMIAHVQKVVFVFVLRARTVSEIMDLFQSTVFRFQK